MKIGNIAKIPTRAALRLILLVDELGLYYSHFDGKIECEGCGLGGRATSQERRREGPALRAP